MADNREYSINVTARDPNTKKYVSTKNDPVAQELRQQAESTKRTNETLDSIESHMEETKQFQENLDTRYAKFGNVLSSIERTLIKQTNFIESMLNIQIEARETVKRNARLASLQPEGMAMVPGMTGPAPTQQKKPEPTPVPQRQEDKGGLGSYLMHGSSFYGAEKMMETFFGKGAMGKGKAGLLKALGSRGLGMLGIAGLAYIAKDPVENFLKDFIYTEIKAVDPKNVVVGKGAANVISKVVSSAAFWGVLGRLIGGRFGGTLGVGVALGGMIYDGLKTWLSNSHSELVKSITDKISVEHIAEIGAVIGGTVITIAMGAVKKAMAGLGGMLVPSKVKGLLKKTPKATESAAEAAAKYAGKGATAAEKAAAKSSTVARMAERGGKVLKFGGKALAIADRFAFPLALAQAILDPSDLGSSDMDAGQRRQLKKIRSILKDKGRSGVPEVLNYLHRSVSGSGGASVAEAYGLTNLDNRNVLMQLATALKNQELSKAWRDSLKAGDKTRQSVAGMPTGSGMGYSMMDPRGYDIYGGNVNPFTGQYKSSIVDNPATKKKTQKLSDIIKEGDKLTTQLAVRGGDTIVKGGNSTSTSTVINNIIPPEHSLDVPAFK